MKSKSPRFFSRAFVLIALSIFIAGVAAAAPPAQAPQAAVRSAPGPLSFLTGPSADDPLEIARGYLQAQLSELGLVPSDLEGMTSEHYRTAHNGTTHVQFWQHFSDIRVNNGMVLVNVAVDGSIINLHNHFVANLNQRVVQSRIALTQAEAVVAAANQLGLNITEPIEIVAIEGGAMQAVVLSSGGISQAEIPVRLSYQLQKDGSVHLVWALSIYEQDSQHWWHMAVAVDTGEILAQEDLVIHEDFIAQYVAAHGQLPPSSLIPNQPSARSGSEPAPFAANDYLVYEWPRESPLHNAQGPAGPPTEGRTVQNAPWNSASPFGWHDTNGAAGATVDNLAPDQYRVYAMPLESPSHGGRTLAVNPANTTASPFGWHDTNGAAGAESNFTVGNNVNAYEDTNNSNSPTGGDAARADGGPTLNFDFPVDLGQQPSTYQDAAITNLFYWNNVIHDVFYQYGFNEASGNFQENNYGNGGNAGDSVNAEAQDGGGTNNANFATPTDGGNPRMQMYLWTLTSPQRDGDFDNGIIVHEYGHGISIRLTGGPGTSSCLNNAEQAGEGWSDWFGLMLSIEAGDQGADRRGIGTYALGEPTTGDGIRDYPYSTNMSIDPRTYDAIKTAAVPHGVGSTWAAMIWEVNWALIDAYGFDPDFYNGTGGNNIALQLVVDGLKLQPCSPGFVDARDAILAADQTNNGGANQCLLWEAFAKRGLGFSASQGSSGSRSDGTEAFDMPPSCDFINATPATQNVCVGSDAVYNIGLGNGFTSPPVAMSAAGDPPDTTITFSPNPVPDPLPNSTAMTVSNVTATAVGNHTITISGDDGVVSENTTVDLHVFPNTLGPTTLLTPADGTSHVANVPTLTWTAVAGAAEYLVEVDDDPAFGSLDYTATTTGNSHTVATVLSSFTSYYWRVTPQNVCAAGAPSAAFGFTTAGISCNVQASTDVPVALPNGTSAISSILVVAGGGPITDVNFSVDMAHLWVGDIDMVLNHQSTDVTVLDRPGVPDSTYGCGGDNILATLDDDAALPVEDQCAAAVPTINGTFSPNNALAAFNGQDSSGTWTLTINDYYTSADAGTLNGWSLEICTSDLAPVVGIDVSDLGSIQEADAQVEQSLTISNTGSIDLVWDIEESPALNSVSATTGQSAASAEEGDASFYGQAGAADCSLIGDIPWISLAPTNGVVPTGANQAIAVTFDSTGLVAGTYTGTLCLNTNDAGNSLVPVSVGLTVVSPSPTAISLGTLGLGQSAARTTGAVVGFGLALVSLGWLVSRRRRRPD